MHCTSNFQPALLNRIPSCCAQTRNACQESFKGSCQEGRGGAGCQGRYLEGAHDAAAATRIVHAHCYAANIPRALTLTDRPHHPRVQTESCEGGEQGEGYREQQGQQKEGGEEEGRCQEVSILSGVRESVCVVGTSSTASGSASCGKWLVCRAATRRRSVCDVAARRACLGGGRRILFCFRLAPSLYSASS